MVMYTETQSDMKTKLHLITKHAVEDKKFKFTSLAHLLNEDSLKECFRMLEKNKAPGIDQVKYEDYEKNLDMNCPKDEKWQILSVAGKENIHTQRKRKIKATWNTCIRG